MYTLKLQVEKDTVGLHIPMDDVLRMEIAKKEGKKKKKIRWRLGCF